MPAAGERGERAAVCPLESGNDWSHVVVVVFVEVGVVALLADGLFHISKSFAPAAIHVEDERASLLRLRLEK